MKTARRVSFNDPGHAHFLTFSCFRRCQLLTDEQTCQLLALSLNKARESHEFELWAYVFMPDHVNLLIRPYRADYAMSGILKSIKGPFAKACLWDWRRRYPARLRKIEVVTKSGMGYRIWQRGGGFDRNLFSIDLIRRAITYIEYNPVRRGIVKNAEDWRWSSARARERYDDAPCLVDDLIW